MLITSPENQHIKRITALYKKKFRDKYGEYIIEGTKVIKEAIKYNQDIEKIFFCPEMIEYDLDIPGIEVTKEIIAKIADTSTTQGIIAVCKIPKVELKNKEKLIFLDKVQDPGNVGTIIRTANAFGFDAVLLSKECADVYSPKVVRATMGALFHIPIIQDVSIEQIKNIGNKIYSSSLETENTLNNVKIDKPFVLVIGNEGQGISQDVKNITDEFVKIRMEGNAESLNASIAAGILMYEFSKK